MTASVTEPIVAEEQVGVRWLHSVSGIVPIGFFLVEHSLLAATSLRGQSAFERSILLVERLPAWPLLEALLILAPLAFHGFYGVVLLANRKERARHSPYSAGWSRASRAAAMIAMVFIGYHFYELRVAKWLGGLHARSFYDRLASDLSSTGASPALPWLALLYLLGVAATSLHFACGTWGFLVRGRYFTRPLAIRRAAYGAAALGALVFGLSAIAVVSLATGAPMLPYTGHETPEVVCPER